MNTTFFHYLLDFTLFYVVSNQFDKNATASETFKGVCIRILLAYQDCDNLKSKLGNIHPYCNVFLSNKLILSRTTCMFGIL